MDTVIGEPGMIKMIYSYLTDNGKLFKQNELLIYQKIIKVNKKTCNCNGYSNTYYVVNGHKIPTSRANKI